MTTYELAAFLTQLSNREVKIMIGGEACDIGAILFTGGSDSITLVPAAPNGGNVWLRDISTRS